MWKQAVGAAVVVAAVAGCSSGVDESTVEYHNQPTAAASPSSSELTPERAKELDRIVHQTWNDQSMAAKVNLSEQFAAKPDKWTRQAASGYEDAGFTPVEADYLANGIKIEALEFHLEPDRQLERLKKATSD